MSETDKQKRDRELREALGNAKVYWTKPTKFEVNAEDGMRMAHALIHSAAGDRLFGRMYSDLGTTFIAQLIPQTGKEKVFLTAWDGEWAMCADAFRKVRQQSADYEYLVKKEARLETDEEANRLVELCLGFSKRAAQGQQDGIRETQAAEKLKEEQDGTHN